MILKDIKQMSEKKFSIITVTYNSEKTIRDTLESVLKQAYDNYEYIIVDGKSTDHTMDIVREYEKKFAGKLVYVSEPDGGIYDAMNKGIRMAKGEIIGIINSDDWYEEDALQKVYDHCTDDPYAIYYGYMRTIDSNNGKEIRCTIHHPEYIREAMINHPATFVSRKVYETYGSFDCQYKMSADYDFIIRMTKEDKVKFVPVYEILSVFRLGGISGTVDALMETMKIKKRYGMMTRMQYLASMCFLVGRKVFGYYTM